MRFIVLFSFLGVAITGLASTRGERPPVTVVAVSKPKAAATDDRNTWSLELLDFGGVSAALRKAAAHEPLNWLEDTAFTRNRMLRAEVLATARYHIRQDTRLAKSAEGMFAAYAEYLASLSPATR